MITKIKAVYYCEYCDKRYLSKGHMNKHEPACTLNPRRQCGMCGDGELVQTEPFACYLEPLAVPEWQDANDLRRVIDGQYDTFIAAVEDTVEGCPACMLAIIRQLKITRIPWEYAEAKADWWGRINDEQAEADYQEMMADAMG